MSLIFSESEEAYKKGLLNLFFFTKKIEFKKIRFFLVQINFIQTLLSSPYVFC